MTALMRARPSITLGGLPGTNDSIVDEREESSDEDESTDVPQATHSDGGEGADAPPSTSEDGTAQDAAMADQEEARDTQSTVKEAGSETPIELTAATETSGSEEIADAGDEDGDVCNEGQAEAANGEKGRTLEAHVSDGHDVALEVTAAAEQSDSGTDVATPMSAGEDVEPDTGEANAGQLADANGDPLLDSAVGDTSKVISFSFPEPPAPAATSALTAGEDSEVDE
jgi:hypothetical protein